MPQVVSRILATIVLMPLSALMYVVLFIIVERIVTHIDEAAFLIAGLVNWILSGVIWTIIWASQLEWTARLVSRTAIATFVAFVAGATVGAFLNVLERDIGFVIGPLVTTVVWFLATIRAWSKASNHGRLFGGPELQLKCPQCTYDFRGLSTLRCPECGSEFTIDQFVARQTWVQAIHLLC